MRLSLWLLILIAAVPGWAGTVRVGSGADCDAGTLADALALAASGDVIELNGEDFPDSNVSLEFDLTLRGGGQVCQSIGATGARARLIGSTTMPGSVLRARFGSVIRATGLIIEGGSAVNGGGIWVDVASRVDANDLLISGNVASASGGGVHIGTAAVFAVLTGAGGSDAGVEINGNQADVGGGIYVGNDAQLLIDVAGTRIASNVANRGGGIGVSRSGQFTLGDVLIEDHNVAGNGGGIYVESVPGSPNVLRLQSDRQTRINNNQALNGGGVYLQAGSQCRIELGAQLSGNIASESGGAIAAQLGSCRIDLLGAVLSGNQATLRGGAVAVAAGAALNLQGTLVAGNNAQLGGALAIDNASLSMVAAELGGVPTGSELSANSASGNGGGIWLSGASAAAFIGDTSGACLPYCRINSNSASADGGGIWAQDAYLETHTGTELSENGAIGNGGGLWAQRITFFALADSSELALRANGNTAQGDGGGFYLLDGGATLSWAEIGRAGLGNSAAGNGGGVYARASESPNMTVQLYNSHINHNAAMDGGGLYVQAATLVHSADLSDDEVTNEAPDCQPSALPTNRYCAELSNNSASADGGAARVVADADLRLIGVAARANQAPGSAAIWAFGADDLELRRVLLAETDGDALQMQVGGDLSLDEVSLLGNSGAALALDGSSGSILAQIDRSLIWDNGMGLMAAGIALNSACNNSQDNSLNGISAPPTLVSNIRGDFHYGTASAGVDLCSGGSMADLDGVPRPLGGSWDVGAFEGEYSVFVDSIFADQFESP